MMAGGVPASRHSDLEVGCHRCSPGARRAWGEYSKGSWVDGRRSLMKIGILIIPIFLVALAACRERQSAPLSEAPWPDAPHVKIWVLRTGTVALGTACGRATEAV